MYQDIAGAGRRRGVAGHGGYTAVSNRVLFDERLGLGDQALYAKLQHLLWLHRDRDDGGVVVGLPVTPPPQRVLAGLLGVGLAKLHRHLANLHEHGYLDWRRRSRRAPLAYRLFDEPQLDADQTVAYPPWPGEPERLADDEPGERPAAECSAGDTTECFAGEVTARAILAFENAKGEDQGTLVAARRARPDAGREERDRLLVVERLRDEVLPLLEVADEKSEVTWARTALQAAEPIDPGLADYLAAKLCGEPGLTAIPADAAYITGVLQECAGGYGCMPDRFRWWPPGEPEDEAERGPLAELLDDYDASIEAALALPSGEAS